MDISQEFVLASGSPRRKELMALAGLSFRVCVSECDEHTAQTDPAAVVEELSLLKAKAVAEGQQPGVCVIGADTIVSIDGRILGKPADTKEAIEMITLLQGRTHQVYTGVSLVKVCADKNLFVHSFHECTQVHVCAMTEAEIENYCHSGEPLDKAGGYGIQGAFLRYVSGIEGDYFNVVGLPVSRLYHELLKA